MATLKSSQKPDSVENFNPWFEQQFSVKLQLYRNYYENAVNNLKEQFIKTPFWGKMQESLIEIEDEFYKTRGVRLFTKTELPTVVLST